MTPTSRARWFRKKVKAHVRNAKLSVDARLLWLILESYANMDGTSCHPAVTTLMKDSGKCRKWVEKYLRELKKAGKIEIHKKQTATGWVNLYTVFYEWTTEAMTGMGIPPNVPYGDTPQHDLLPGINRPVPSEVSEMPSITVLPDPAPAPVRAVG